MRSPVILKEWPVYLFSRGDAIFVCIPAVSQVTDTLMWTTLRKNPKSRVCVCTSTGPDYKRFCFLTHATPGLTPPACVSFPPQPSQPSRGKSLPGVRRDLSEPEGVFFKQNKQLLGCWVGGNQAPVVKLSERNVSGFAELQGVRGHISMTVYNQRQRLDTYKMRTCQSSLKRSFYASWNIYEL